MDIHALRYIDVYTHTNTCVLVVNTVKAFCPMPKQTYIHTYIDAYVIAVNDFIKLFYYRAKRLLFNCYVVVYILNKQTKKQNKNTKKI